MFYQLSVECISDRVGVPGEVVYDDVSIPVRQGKCCSKVHENDFLKRSIGFGYHDKAIILSFSF